MQKIVPFLWFDGQLEAAARFYTTVFKNARVESISPMSATFVLEGQEFMGLNGGPQYRFNEAVSFFVRCDGQDEVDFFWHKLLAGGGAEGRCGWLKDQFGLSWQIIPAQLGQYLGDANRAKADRVLQAMLTMNKIDVASLHAAFTR